MKRVLLAITLFCGAASAQWTDFTSSTASSVLIGAMNGKLNWQTGSGNPNGSFAGTAGKDAFLDSTNLVEYICTVTGTTSTAVWKQLAMATETWAVGTGGVTANTCVQMDTSNPSKIIAGTTGCYGIAVSTVSAAGSVEVTRTPYASCVTDTGGSTAGDLAIQGTGTTVDCKDSGQTTSSAISIGTRIIGVFRQTVTAGNPALIELTPSHFGTSVTLTALASQANATMVANTSGGSASPTAVAIPTSANIVGTNTNGALFAATAGNITALTYAAGGGTAQAQTATYSPAATLTDGILLCWKPTAANTATAPTFSPNTLTAHTIVKVPNATALVANDLITTQVACAIYNLSATHWELQNPATAAAGGSNPFSTNNAYTYTSGTTTVDFSTYTSATVTPSAGGVNPTLAFTAPTSNLSTPVTLNLCNFATGTPATWTLPGTAKQIGTPLRAGDCVRNLINYNSTTTNFEGVAQTTTTAPSTIDFSAVLGALPTVVGAGGSDSIFNSGAVNHHYTNPSLVDFSFFKTGADCNPDTGVCTKTNNVAFGTAATVNTGTSGATIPLNNGNNTSSGNDSYTGSNDFSAATWKIPNCVSSVSSATNMVCNAAGIVHVWTGSDNALGTAAFVNTGTSGATLGLLNGNLTFGGSNAYGTPASITLTNATGLPNAGLVNPATTVNGATCTLGSACAPYGGVVTYTANHTVGAADIGKLVVMNCTSTCALTFKAAPAATDWFGVETIGSTVATVSLNSLNYNGASSVPVLNNFRDMRVASDGSNYFGDAPLVAGTNVTITPASNGATIAASGAQTIASGTASLGTSAISSAACATVVTVTATGVATTDVISFTPNVSIKAVTGYTPATTGGLTITSYPTSGNVNFDVCNWSSGSITPGAVTLNWRVSR